MAFIDAWCKVLSDYPNVACKKTGSIVLDGIGAEKCVVSRSYTTVFMQSVCCNRRFTWLQTYHIICIVANQSFTSVFFHSNRS